MRKQGFTLIELSIVLVIISLIIGAISVGGIMIRNSEIQAVSKEVGRYIPAIQAFQDKYSALPGDFTQAATYIVTVAGVADGNGDGTISFNSHPTTPEEFQAWLHLKAAALIEGTYSGTASSNKRVRNTNVPASQLSGAGWGLVYVPITSADLLYRTGDIPPNHVLWLGGNSVTGGNNIEYTVLSGEEAEQIDRTLDDGNAATGKIVAQVNATGDCYDLATFAYNVITAGKNCALVFKTGL